MLSTANKAQVYDWSFIDLSNFHTGTWPNPYRVIGIFCMQLTGFFDWLGHTLGSAIRFIVDRLEGALGAVADAIDAFLGGMARAIGMDVSLFSLVLLILGLLFLYKGVRALLRKAIFAGVIWLLLGLVLMGWLIR
jgi:hypothetical protein